MSFFTELKRRNVIRIGGFCLGSARLVAQVRRRPGSRLRLDHTVTPFAAASR